MTISGIDYISVVIAAVAALVWTFIYYVTLFKYWRAAAGWSVEEVKARSSLASYLMTFVGLVIMSWMSVRDHWSIFGASPMTAKTGAIYAVFIWLGSIAPTSSRSTT